MYKIRKHLWLVLLAFVLMSPTVDAQTPEIPKILSDGLEAFRKNGGNSAVDIWLQGSPIEKDVQSRASITGGMGQVEGLFGKMLGFDILKSVDLGPVTKRFYLIFRFERGPMYASVDCYKAPNDWIISSLEFNAKANLIFPASLLGG